MKNRDERSEMGLLHELAVGKTPKNLTKEQEFLDTFARAFLSWQFVESNLFLIYSTFMVDADKQKVSATYHSVLNLNIKLGIIDAAAKVVLGDDPLFQKWIRLSETVGRKANMRNSLAHFTVTARKKKNGAVALLLHPTTFDVRPSKKQYDIKHLISFRDDFISLSQDLFDFLRDLYVFTGKIGRPAFRA